MKAKLTLIACALLLMSNIAGAQEQKAPSATIQSPAEAATGIQEAPSAGAQEEEAPSAGAQEEEAPSATMIGRDIGEQVGKRIDEIVRNVMGHGMTDRGMTGRGMMGRGMFMRVMMALMDNDGDGTLSLEEFQTGHEKIFKVIDADKDGKVTLEEMQMFFRGGSPTSDR